MTDKERKVVELAKRVRAGCYSVKAKLKYEDRLLFDELNLAVDDLSRTEVTR